MHNPHERLEALNTGNLTCDLLDASSEVVPFAFPNLISWRSTKKGFMGPAYPVYAPEGDLVAVRQGLESAPRGSVLVIATDRCEVAIWGETLTRIALEKELAGVVSDGACRDVNWLQALEFPVLCRGTFPKRGVLTGRGKHPVQVTLLEVSVNPGDLIVSDLNGAVLVPSSSAITIIDQLYVGLAQSE